MSRMLSETNFFLSVLCVEMGDREEGGVLAVNVWLSRLNKNHHKHTQYRVRHTMLMIEVKHFDSLTQLSVKHCEKEKLV